MFFYHDLTYQESSDASNLKIQSESQRILEIRTSDEQHMQFLITNEKIIIIIN